MNDVEWRDVPGHPGYRVSSCGEVVSLKRGNRVLRPSVDGGGYRQASLWNDGVGSTVKVHRLVLSAFVGPRPSGCVTRHLNGDKTDNRIENLRWGTQKENVEDTRRHGTLRFGERHMRAKMTEEDVLTAKALNAGGMSMMALSRKYGVHYATMECAIKGRTWKHLCTEDAAHGPEEEGR